VCSLRAADGLRARALSPYSPSLADGEKTRKLGLTVLRGTPIALIAPVEGTVEIDNPFVQAEEKPVIQ
jgi:U6 snRNA-associated Sm-like protein LSm7